MASHFSANQFEREYHPRQLGNWEVPKVYPKRPDPRKGCTKVIANQRGHLLPSVKRPNSNPWGDFKNTWQLPDKITRSVINQLHSPPSGSSRWKRPWNFKKAKGCPLEADLCVQGETHEILGGNLDKPKSACLDYTPGDITKPQDRHSSRRLLVQKKDDELLNRNPKPALNELYTEHHDCTDALALLEEKKQYEKEDTPHILGTGVPDNLEALQETAPLEVIGNEIPDAVLLPKMRFDRPVAEKPTERPIPRPIVPAYCNFLTARKMAQENLEHQPLPDAVMDLAFRKLQAQGALNPGLALDVMPITTGIGCKNYKAGPTQCTKLRVYRPKTCGVVPPILDKAYSQRPMTSFIIKDKMGAMDLAIGWDYRPKDPRDEPKKPKHIDGSNGSAAPAVFTLVKTPTPPTPSKEDPGHITHSEGIFNNTLGEVDFFDRDVVRQHKEHRKKYEMGRKCDCGKTKRANEEVRPRTSSGNGSNVVKSPKLTTNGLGSGSEERRRSKSTSNLSDMVRVSDNCLPKENESIFGYHLHGRRHCNKTDEKLFCPKHEKGHRLYYANGRTRSQEPLMPAKLNSAPPPPLVDINKKNQRTPRMCQQENQEPYLRDMQKDDYKTAFKAGIPNSNSSGTCTSFDSGIDTCSNASSVPCIKTALKIPKPRQPFVKKNYSISTLNPPFSCFRGGAGQGGYPEHWRLASVYQHAYKPIETRKRPLLQTVFQ